MMTAMNDQIITSRLDNDFYAFTMGQLIWKYFKNVTVRYKFFNRGTQLDPSFLPELGAQINACYSLRATNDEIDYLYSLGMFDVNYLQWLHNSQLPEVHRWVEDGAIQIEYIGSWASAVFWETPLLAILTELFMKHQNGFVSFSASMNRFFDKSEILGQHPDVKIMEFGSRRRASKQNQENILRALKEYNEPNLLGTSNVMFAKELGLKPMGTMAHQLFMVNTALHEANTSCEAWLADGSEIVIDLFEELYGNHPEMLIYLPDTYGTRTGLNFLTSDQANKWAGIRQDSGNPGEIIRQIIDFYISKGIDPRTKLIVPSDGLTINKAIELYVTFGSEANLAFGIGTSLTNDVGMHAPNFVIKPRSANGHPCVKLSDAAGKVTGNSEIVTEYRQAALDLRKNPL